MNTADAAHHHHHGHHHAHHHDGGHDHGGHDHGAVNVLADGDRHSNRAIVGNSNSLLLLGFGPRLAICLAALAVLWALTYGALA